jgi:hypothetical protein
VKRFGFLLAALLAALLATSSVSAAENYTLFGDASLVSPGNASNTAVELDGTSSFAGVAYYVAPGTTFADVTQLATDYRFLEGTCQLGSPRFVLSVEDQGSGDTGNISVYIGPPPSYTGCPVTPSYQNTGDLLEGVNPIDTSQLDGGTFYDPYTTALAKYSTYTVTDIYVVTDGYGQVLRVDNTVVGDDLYTYEPNVPLTKDDCKDGGFKTHTRADFSEFKNQGDCIQYVNTGK